MNYSSLLETYTLQDILELNDIDETECLKFLVESEFVTLPEIQPLEFND